jgi:hypothetical protein
MREITVRICDDTHLTEFTPSPFPRLQSCRQTSRFFVFAQRTQSRH